MEMICVNLRDYEKFWSTFRKDVGDFTGSTHEVPRHDVAKQWIKEWYSIDVEIMPQDSLGICQMTEKQFSWFVLQWSK
jgi:hypothetical protein